MKLPIYLFTLLICLGCAEGYGQSRKISIDASEKSLKQVFDQIQTLSGYSILYSDDVVLDTMTANIHAAQQPVSDILDTILRPQHLFYYFSSNELIVIGSERLKKEGRLQSMDNLILSGRVYDEQHHMVPFVSIYLSQGALTLAGTAADEKGAFTFSFPFKTDSTYFLHLSSVGFITKSFSFIYPDTSSLQEILLKKDKNTLSAISLKARKPLFERKADRYIVNVAGSLLADGGNALEVLEKSPGVWVDINGSIRISGNHSVSVMINDVVQRMSQADLADYLRTIKSEDIEKIEIIPNPPSEFEASGTGGIVHIILKKTKVDGFSGLVSTAYQQQNKRPYYGEGLSLNYKLNKFYAFGNVHYSKDQSDYYASTQNTYPDKSIYTGITNRHNNNRSATYMLGAVWDLAPNQSIGLQGSHNSGRQVQSFLTGIELKQTPSPLKGNSSSYWNRDPSFTTATINYKVKLDTIGSDFKIIGDYAFSNKAESNDFTSTYSDPLKDSRYRNHTLNATTIYSGQADYTKVFKNKLELKGGIKFADTRRDNNLKMENYKDHSWTTDTQASNRFIYDENLLMGYGSLAKTIHKTSLKLGLRSEQTYSRGNSVTMDQQFKKNYLNLFPSFFILQKLKKNGTTALYFSYSRRIQRPQFSDLNPFRLHFDDYTVLTGNPDLLPELTQSLKLGYTFLKDFSVDLFYQSTKNIIAELANPVSNNVIEYQSQNFDIKKNYGLSLFAPVNIFSWWSMNNSADFFQASYALNDFIVDQSSIALKIMNTFSFKNNWDAGIYTNYSTPYVIGNTRWAPLFVTVLSVGKKLLKKKLRLRFMMGDVFNTFREKTITHYKNTTINFYQKRPTQTFGLSASFSFSSGKKFKDKKVEQSNEAEKERL